MAAAAVLWPATAAADDPAAEADALFVEAKRLMAEGRYAEACPKLEQSQRLDPGGGTLVALALCLESEGRIATAAATYTKALEVAVATGNENRAAVARARLAALEPRLAWIVVEVTPAVAALPGLEITIDGASLARPWDAQPVDPGVRRVEARAPGRQPFVALCAVRAEGARGIVRIDALVEEALRPEARAADASAAPAAASRAPAAAPEQDGAARSSPLRTAGWITGAAGLVIAGFGAGFGVKALSEDAAADERCPGDHCDDPRAVESSRDAVASGDAATVLVTAGAGALAAGAVLLWLGSTAERPGPRVAFSVRGAGGAVSASF